MELLTTALKQRFTEVGDQSESTNPLVIAKFFNPCGAGTWYVTEYYAEDQTFFCYVTGLAHDEWGYTSLIELEALVLPYGLKIERDIHFKETRFKDLNLR